MNQTFHSGMTALHVRDYWAVLQRRRWVALTCAAVLFSTIAVGTFLQTPVYQATAKVLIEREAPRVVSFEEVSRIDATQDYYQTQYEIIRSRPLVEKVIARLNLMEEWPALTRAEDPVSAFLANLTIEPIRNSRLVGITVEAHSPALAASAANMLATLYVEGTVSTRADAARQALNWLSDQLIDLKAKAQDSETSLQRYKEESGLIAVEEKQDITVKKLQEFNSEYIGAKARRLELETQIMELRRALKDRARLEAAPVIVQNPVIQRLKTDLIVLEVKKSEMLQTYTDKHPEVLKIRSQIDKINGEISAEVSRVVRSTETEYNALRAREEAMLAAVSQYKDEVQGLAKKQIQYGVLKRDADSNQEMYNLLQKRVKETALEGGLPASNVRLVETATAPMHVARPNKPLSLGLGMLVSLLLAAAAAFFADYMDNTVRSPRDVEQLINLKVIGMIPIATPRRVGEA